MREGFASILNIECDKCKEQFILESSHKVKCGGTKKNIYAVNVRAVMGQSSTGGGPSHLNETAATLDMPGMPTKTFISIEESIGQSWEKLLADEIAKAGAEERELAIERKDSFQGVPAISVTVDAGWSCKKVT